MKKNVFIMEHPLIQHKISMLRDERTGTNEFRRLIEEITVLMGYEALRDLPLEDIEIKTPIETCLSPMVSGKKLAIVPILRAGLGMVGGILTLVRKRSDTSVFIVMKRPTNLTNIFASFRLRLNREPSSFSTRCWPPAVPPSPP